MNYSVRRSRFRLLAIGAFTLTIGLTTGWFASRLAYSMFEQGLTSLSPDDRWRVRLFEIRRPMGIDRNFVLRLEDTASGSTREIFSSPDEGRPEGSEWVIWSEDSSRFLLVGRHFFLYDHKPTLANGDVLYLMCDVKTGQVWCNSEQSGLPHFTTADLAAVRWREAVVSQ